MADTSDIKNGIFLDFKGAIHVVTDFQHVNPGKGSAFVRTKMKDIQTGKTLEHTFKSGETIEMVEMDRSTMQFLYKDGDSYNFMDTETYEQAAIGTEIIGDDGQYLKEGMEVTVTSLDGVPMTVILPKKVTLKVTEAAPAVKGDTASGNVKKEVTLETGMKIGVPIFVKQGDDIVVNTESGEYVERA